MDQSVATELAKLKDLLEMGFIGEEEFRKRAHQLTGDGSFLDTSTIDTQHGPLDHGYSNNNDNTDYYSDSRPLGYSLPDSLYSQPIGAHGISEFMSTHSYTLHAPLDVSTEYSSQQSLSASLPLNQSFDSNNESEAVYGSLYSSTELSLPTNARAALEATGLGLPSSPMRHSFNPVAQGYREAISAASPCSSPSRPRANKAKSRSDGDNEESFDHIFTSPVVPPASAGGKSAWNWMPIEPNTFVVVYRAREGYWRSSPQPVGVCLVDFLAQCGLTQGRLILVHRDGSADMMTSKRQSNGDVTQPTERIEHGLYRLELALQMAHLRPHRTATSFRVIESATTSKYGANTFSAPFISLYPGSTITASAARGVVVLYSTHTSRDRTVLRKQFQAGVTMQEIAESLCQSNFTLRAIYGDAQRVAFPYSPTATIPAGDYRLVQPQTVLKRELYHHTFIVDSYKTSQCVVADVINTYRAETAPALLTSAFPHIGSTRPSASADENRKFMSDWVATAQKAAAAPPALQTQLRLQLQMLFIRHFQQATSPLSSISHFPNDYSWCWYKHLSLPELERAIQEKVCIVNRLSKVITSTPACGCDERIEDGTFLCSKHSNEGITLAYNALKSQEPWLFTPQQTRDLRSAIGPAVQQRPERDGELIVSHTTKFSLANFKTYRLHNEHQVSRLVKETLKQLSGEAANSGDSNKDGNKTDSAVAATPEVPSRKPQSLSATRTPVKQVPHTPKALNIPRSKKDKQVRSTVQVQRNATSSPKNNTKGQPLAVPRVVQKVAPTKT